MLNLWSNLMGSFNFCACGLVFVWICNFHISCFNRINYWILLLDHSIHHFSYQICKISVALCISSACHSHICKLPMQIRKLLYLGIYLWQMKIHLKVGRTCFERKVQKDLQRLFETTRVCCSWIQLSGMLTSHFWRPEFEPTTWREFHPSSPTTWMSSSLWKTGEVTAL